MRPKSVPTKCISFLPPAIIQKNLFLGLCLLFIAWLPQKVVVAQSPEDMLREGTILFNRQMYGEAEDVYRKLINLHPKYEAAYERLAYSLYLQDNKMQEANEVYKKLLQVNPDSLAAYYGIQDTSPRRDISEIDREKNLNSDQAMEFLKLADDAEQKGDYLKAIQYYQVSVIASEYSYYFGLTSLYNLSRLYLKHGYFDALLIMHEQWIARNPPSNYPSFYGYEPFYYGVALSHFNRHAEAEKILQDKIASLSKLFNFLGKESDASNPIEDDISMLYKYLQRSLIEQGKIERALEIAEQSRVRGLVDVLIRRFFRDDFPIVKSPHPNIAVEGSGKQAEAVGKLPTLTINEIRNVVKRHNSTVVYYSIIPSSKDRSKELYIWVIQPSGELTFQKQLLSSSISDSLASFIEDTKERILQRGEAPVQSLSIQDLKEGDLIKTIDHEDYPTLNPYRILSIDLENQNIHVENVENKVDFIIDFSQVRQKVQYRAGRYKHLQELYNILIRPIQQHLPDSPDENIIFIPQDELSSIPFAALQDEYDRFLIERHTISTAPALQILDLTNKRKQQVQGKSSQVLVVGNPSMPTLPGSSEPLSQLPAAQEEASAIGELWETHPFIGKDATKANVISRIPQARIMHFATHGILNNQNGINSFLALTPSHDNNGFLTAEEIFKLQFQFESNVELAILSACNTGLGTPSTDGIIGLARAMIATGTPSVLISLWSLPDAPTADLMIEFHRQIQQNSNNAQAIRQAMLKTIETNPDPRDWAGFTLVGQP